MWKLLPIRHADNTGRLQTVKKNDNKFYYDLLTKFYKETKIPLLLNTSFNIQEPVVCTPLDAIKCFKKSNMDYLIVENFIITKKKMTVFINNHTTTENGNGFYLLDLIDHLNLKSVKIISLSCETKNKQYKVFTLKNKKKSKNFLGKILEIFFMNYLIFKNINKLKNETIIFTSDPPMVGIILILISKILKLNLIFGARYFSNTLIVSDILKKQYSFLIIILMNKFIYKNEIKL